MTQHMTVLRRGRKFEQVLAGARRVFLVKGFEASSMDDVARESEVSKATVYSYFPDKQHLFVQVVQSECERQADHAMQRIDQEATPQVVLTSVAHQLLGFMVSDFGQRMVRICVSEAERFPQLGQSFYENGPMVVRARLREYFQCAVARGVLGIDDFDLAADQFSDLCKAGIFPRILFGVQTQFSPDEIEWVIAGAVKTFLARYGLRSA